MKPFTVINSTHLYLKGRKFPLFVETWKMSFMEFLEKYREYDIYVYSFDPEYVRAVVIKDVNNLLLLGSN